MDGDGGQFPDATVRHTPADQSPIQALLLQANLDWKQQHSCGSGFLKMLHRDLSGLCEIGLDHAPFEHALDESSSRISESAYPIEDTADIPDVLSRHKSGLKRLSRVIDTLPRL